MTACRRSGWLLILWVVIANGAVGSEPWPDIPQLLPPAGIEVSEAAKRALDEKCQRLEKRLAERPAAANPLLVDVEIFAKAVRFALDGGEFYADKDVKQAEQLLKAGEARLDELTQGKPSWTSTRGRVVRGYRSAVDDSVQPYGLVVPEKLDLSKPVPLYVWLHGRGDKLTDLAFLAERQRQVGQVVREDAIVLHPFGRSCLGWKSTAEIDVLEAIASVASRYTIDPDRVALLGFSMGGAGAWHLGAHYADRFAAVHAGAGFVDVARYQGLKPADYPPIHEQKLWGVYDVPDYVRNLFNLPVVAYSGEVDKQKDAADFMAEVFAAHGRELDHLIGPGLGHKYDPAVWKEVLVRVSDAVARGRDSHAKQVSWQGRTLRYGRLKWVQTLGLKEHWQDSRIDAAYVGTDLGSARLEVTTKNVTQLALDPPQPVATLTIDGEQLLVPTPLPSSSHLEFEKLTDHWRAVDGKAVPAGLRKKPGLQGPIDDVLLEPFLVVLPTGTSSPEITRWVDFEREHFIRRWRNVYRGTLRVKRDVDVTADDCRAFHLIAWGDDQSNAIIRRAVQEGGDAAQERGTPKFPVQWQPAHFKFGSQVFDRQRHLALVIYPNPLNPDKYLVLNSGPTHREQHDRTNSLQNPKLGDWAIVDVTVAPNGKNPGKIVSAGFFDEQWGLPDQVSTDSTPTPEIR